MSPGTAQRWFVPLRGGGRLRHRIYCFPYAGVGASVYRRLAGNIPDGIELSAVQFPGREDRFSEAPLVRLSSAIGPLASALQALPTVPFSFFGHSMGALVAFELARELRKRQWPTPRHLFLSGRRAPHLASRRRPLHALPSAELHAELRDLGGTLPEVLDDPELMELLEPILRADFQLCETHRHADDDPLDIPLYVFGGSGDSEATGEELAAWKVHSARFAGVRMFPGHHFYLLDEWESLMGNMQAALTQARGDQ